MLIGNILNLIILINLVSYLPKAAAQATPYVPSSRIPPVPACAKAFDCLKIAADESGFLGECGGKFGSKTLPASKPLRCYCKRDKFVWEFGQCVNATERCDGVGYELRKSLDFVHDICENAGVFLNKERLYVLESRAVDPPTWKLYVLIFLSIAVVIMGSFALMIVVGWVVGYFSN